MPGRGAALPEPSDAGRFESGARHKYVSFSGAMRRLRRDKSEKEVKSGGMARYTQQQRNAYRTGRAYRLGREKKVITFRNPANRESFRAGYKNAGRNLSKYKNI